MSETATIDAENLQTLLTDMVGIYSPSGKEQELCDFLVRYFRSRGIPVETIPVDEDRYNLVVRPQGREAELMFTGHLDTVPASNPDQLDPKIEDGHLVGLGSADMKSGCAAMIEAYIDAYLLNDGDIPVMLALVVGEEELADGIAALLEYEVPPLAIDSEPTDLRVCVSHYGYLEVELETVGVKRHAAEAGWDRNAVYSMLHSLTAVTGHLAKSRQDIICNIRDLHSSTAGFAVSDRCAAWLDLHFPPTMTPDDLSKEIGEILDRSDRELPGTILPVRFPTRHGGFTLGADGPLLQSLQAAYEQLGQEWSTAAFRSHSDANQMWENGIQTVMCGPGRLSYAHTTNERVPIDQTVQAARIYRAVLENFEN